MFPTLPPWEGLHPLVVHFPIGLLLVVPLFVLLATVSPARGWWFGWTAVILLALGTGGAFVAVATGEAARDAVEDGPDAMFNTMDRREELAGMARSAFAVLTGIYAAILVLPRLWKTLSKAPYHVGVNLAFLAALTGANVLLANVAHLGGRLVHEYGVRADLGTVPAASAGDAPVETSEEQNADEPDDADEPQDTGEPKNVGESKDAAKLEATDNAKLPANIALKCATYGKATANLASAALVNGLAATAAPIVDGIAADWFSMREFTLTLRWVSLGSAGKPVWMPPASVTENKRKSTFS